MEKRKTPRLRVKFDVLINGSVRGDALDISEGGMFIHTSTPFPEGTELKLSFTPCPDCFLVDIIARVQFLHRGLAIGVVFLNLDEMDSAMIKKFVDDSMVKSGFASEGGVVDTRKKILIVDASSPARMMAKNTLLLRGFAVAEAESVVDAIEAIKLNKPNMIVFDAMIDGMHGDTFLHMLRDKIEWRDILVVLMTGHVSPDSIEKLALFGIVAILPKMSTTPKKLAEKVEEILGECD